MKIILVNKFWNEQYGTGVHLNEITRMLTANGHEVIPFGVAHPDNKPTKYDKYFVPYRNLEKPRLSLQSLGDVFKMVYNSEARRLFSKLLDDTQPDLIHVHTIHHHISPSILIEARRRELPIVHTVHDYKLICPSYHVPFRDGQVCQRCVGKNWLHVIGHRAHKNSLLATIAVTFESAVHALTGVYSRSIDRYIMPSNSIAHQHIDNGVDPKRVSVIPHTIDMKKWKPATNIGEGVLFAGRLAAERGLEHVLAAAQALPRHKFSVVGDGPERATLEARIKMLNLSNIKLYGHVSASEMQKLFCSHRVLFFPTQMFEPFGLSILEAMASAKPVVATRLGAIPELVEHGKTGFTYDSNDAAQGILHLRAVLENRVLAQELGVAARKASEEYRPEEYYRQLEQVYSDAMIKHVRRQAKEASSGLTVGATS